MTLYQIYIIQLAQFDITRVQQANMADTGQSSGVHNTLL